MNAFFNQTNQEINTNQGNLKRGEGDAKTIQLSSEFMTIHRR